MKPSTEVTNWLKDQKAKDKPTIEALRSLIFEAMPEAHEFIYHSALCYQSGEIKFFPIIYIGTYTNHINLGFYHGASLNDSKQLLTGSGKQMRHIKIESIDDIKNPAIIELLKEAWANGLVEVQRSHNT